MIASTSAALRRSDAWITTPTSAPPSAGVPGRTARHRSSVASVVAWSSMSIRTKAPIAAARSTIASTFPRASAGSMARPICDGLSETLRSRPRAARASRRLQVSCRGRTGVLRGGHRFAEHVDRRAKPPVPEAADDRQRLVEGLPRDEPPDHRPGDRDPSGEASERAAVRQREQRRAHRPLRGRGRDAAEGALVPAGARRARGMAAHGARMGYPGTGATGKVGPDFRAKRPDMRAVEPADECLVPGLPAAWLVRELRVHLLTQLDRAPDTPPTPPPTARSAGGPTPARGSPPRSCPRVT